MTGPNFQQQTDDTTDLSNTNQSQEGTQDPSDLGGGDTSQPNSEDNSSSDSEELRMLTQVAQNATRQNQLLQQQLQQLQQQMEGVSRSVQQNTPTRPIVTDEDFQTSPSAALERLLDHKLSATISPLLEEQKNQQRIRTVNSVLPQVLSAINPNAAAYAEGLAPAVLEILGTADPTPANIRMATIMAVGNYALSGAPATSNTPSNEPPVRRSSNPPNVPNNAPRTKAPEKIKLTEQQRRLANKLGYKEGQEADFLKFLEADEVTFQ
jgi:hypothetical protein